MTEAQIRAFFIDLKKLSVRHNLVLRGHLEIDDLQPGETGMYYDDEWKSDQPRRKK